MAKQKESTETKRKTPSRNPRYELARLEILQSKIIERMKAEKARHEKKLAWLTGELDNAKTLFDKFATGLGITAEDEELALAPKA